MALTTVCGAECGIVTAGLATAANRHWAAVNGTPAIEGTVVRSGSKSFRFAAAATNPSLQPTAPTSQTVAYVRLYFRMTDATPSSTTTLIYLDSGTSASSGYISVSTGGVLYAAFNGTTGQQNGPTLSNDTWYGIEAEVDISANPNVIRWRTWDAGSGWTSQTNVSVAQAAATFGATHEIGIASGPTSGLTVYMDDMLVGFSTTTGSDYSTSSSKGGKVLRYLPSADGAHSAFTTGDFKYNNSTNIANTATDVYTYLDDADQTSIADGYISQNVAGAGKYVRVAFADEGTETSPRAVGITSTHHSSGTGANEMHLRVSDDGTNWTNVWGNWATAGLDTSDTSAHFLHKVLATKPSGGAWTAGTVNSLEAEWGNSDDVSAVPFYDSISLEVEWTEATTGTGAVALLPAAVSGTGTQTFTSTGALTLQPVAVSGTGIAGAVGTGALTFQPVSVSGTGLAGAIGTGAVTLQPVSVSGTGTQTFSATGALTLQPVSVSGTGTQTFSASGSVTLQPVAVSGTGIAGMVGTGAATLQPVAVSGTGTHTEDTGASGTGDLTLQPVVVSGTGTQTFSASGSITLQPAAVSGTGLAGSIATGSITLQPVSVSGTGSQTISGSGAIVLPVVLVSGAGSSSVTATGTGAIALAAIAVSGAGVCTNPAMGSVVVEEVRPWTATVEDEGRGTLSVAISGVWSIDTESSPVWSVELVDEQV